MSIELEGYGPQQANADKDAALQKAELKRDKVAARYLKSDIRMVLRLIKRAAKSGRSQIEVDVDLFKHKVFCWQTWSIEHGDNRNKVDAALTNIGYNVVIEIPHLNWDTFRSEQMMRVSW